VIPFIGWGGTGTKWGRKIAHAADTGGHFAGSGVKVIVKTPLRVAYETEVKALRDVYENMLKRGVNEETMARTLSQMRRDIGIKYKDLTAIDILENEIYPRNIKKYGDKLGPTVEWLRAKGKSWKEIIEGAMRPDGSDLF